MDFFFKIQTSLFSIIILISEFYLEMSTCQVQISVFQLETSPINSAFKIQVIIIEMCMSI